MKNLSLSTRGNCHVLKSLQLTVIFKKIFFIAGLVSPLLSLAGSLSFFPTAVQIETRQTFVKHYEAFLATDFAKKNTRAPLGTTESMRLNLYLLNADSSTILADGDFAEYNNLYHDSVTVEDAPKFTNILENIALLRYGKTLSVERRPIITANDTLFIKLWKTTQRRYQLELVANMVTNAGLQAFFVDSYLGTATPVGIDGNTIINFEVTAAAASKAVDRFKIIFKPKAAPSVTSAATFTSVDAYPHAGEILVGWNVKDEMNVARYEVEKSTNGTDFKLVNTTAVNAGVPAPGNYSWLDNHSSIANYYRIKDINVDGSFQYTKIVKVMGNNTPVIFSTYPNPAVKGNAINLQLTDQPAGIYAVKLIGLNGRVVYSGKFSVTSTTTLQPLKTTQLQTGMYQVAITNANNVTQVQKIIVQ